MDRRPCSTTNRSTALCDDARLGSPRPTPKGQPDSQPRVGRLALHRQHPEHALMHPVERLLHHKPLQCLDAERELAQRKAALATKTALALALQETSLT